MIMRRASLAALICLFPAAPLSAQAVHDSIGWHFLGTLGYVQTSGNTDLSTVNVTERLAWRPNATWQVTHSGAWVYGKTGGVESANQILADMRADYSIGSNIYAYGLVTYERNTYAGISHRYAELLGLGWSAISSPKQTLSVDVGAGNTQQITGGVSASYWVGRLAPKYRYNITDKAYAEQVLDFLDNLGNTDDLRIASTTALVAPLTRSIAIRLSYLMRYTAQPPINPATAAPFKKLDTTFQSGIQISL